MIKRVTPEDYFTNFFPYRDMAKETGGGPRTDETQKIINEIVTKVKEGIKPQEQKVVYVPQPYQVQLSGSENTVESKIPWGLIAIVTIVGLIVLGVVAITGRGK